MYVYVPYVWQKTYYALLAYQERDRSLCNYVYYKTAILCTVVNLGKSLATRYSDKK